MKYIYSILLIALIIPGYLAFSQENKKAITLNECINIAIQNNPALMVAEEDKKRALAEYRMANAARNISISADIRTNQYPKQVNTSNYAVFQPYLPFINGPGAPSDVSKMFFTYESSHQASKKNFIDELSSHYTLGISFGISAGVTLYNEKNNRIVDQAKSGIKLSELQARKALSDVIFSVKKSYYDYMLAQESVRIQEKLLKYNQDRLKLIEVFYKTAQKQLYDYNKAKYDVSDAELQLQKAKNTERAARLALLLAMGINDPGAEFVLDRKDEMPVLQYSLPELDKLGELNYPDLQIIKMQKDISKIKVSVEKAGHYPTVDLQLQAAYENGQLDKYVFDSSNWKPSFGAGFIARIPIYSGGMVSARVDSAETDYNKTVYKVKDTRTNMELNLQNSYTLLQELARQIAMSKLMMENSEKNYRVALRSYESGATTMLELNDANIARINSEYSYLKTRNDYLMTLAKISSIVGLGEDALCKK